MGGLTNCQICNGTGMAIVLGGKPQPCICSQVRLGPNPNQYKPIMHRPLFPSFKPKFKSLTIDEFRAILKYIHENHELVKGRCIKYVDCSFDFRTHEVWRVELRGFFRPSKVFTHTNASDESRQIPLYDQIMTWLKKGEK